MADKRWKKRQRKRIALRFGVDAASKIGFTDDITREGLFIRTALVFNPGTRLQVELDPPEGRIVLEGEVRWAKRVPPQMIQKIKGGMGLSILSFKEGQAVYQQICDILYSRDA